MPVPLIVHFVLMALMCVLVVAAAAVARKRADGWFPRHRRLALLGAVSGAAGITVMSVMKLAAGYPHFQSVHAIAGGVTLLFLVLTPLFGWMTAGGKEGMRGPHKVLGRVLAVVSVLVVLTGIGRFLQISGRR